MKTSTKRKDVVALHHSKTVKRLGNVSEFKLPHTLPCKSRFYRSIMPLGLYDDAHDVLSAWRRHKFTHVISLTPQEEIKRKVCGSLLKQIKQALPSAAVIRLPIEKNMVLMRRTAFIKSFGRLLHRVFDELATCRRPHKVVVHCSAGVGRTGFFFAGLLMHLGYNLLDSVALVERNLGKRVAEYKLDVLDTYFDWYLETHPDREDTWPTTSKKKKKTVSKKTM